MTEYEDLNKRVLECLKHVLPTKYSSIIFTLKKSEIFWCLKIEDFQL